MKFVVAPESTRASACALLPYTQSVTGSLNDNFLLRAILLIQDSSTTFSDCSSEPMLGILFLDCRSQAFSSTVPLENPLRIVDFLPILVDSSVLKVPPALHRLVQLPPLRQA